MQRIAGIDKGSIAEELDVLVGDFLISINGQAVLDVVDYEYLCAQEHLILSFLREGTGEYEEEIEKDEWEPLGLSFDSGLMSDVRTCKNKCIFCFVDQMPPGGRDTLQFKDDDWRMSFIMGNYISLTNVSDTEFERILARRVSPLYISVHATDPATRVMMMRNPQAGKVLARLQALADAGLHFHCQIVCCPGINDGEILQRSMKELFALYPMARSLAVVPVGLTKFRENLYPVQAFDREKARATLWQVRAFQKDCLQTAGTRFVFAADELVLLAEENLPAYKEYEEFPQIENGVGLLRAFEYEFLEAFREMPPRKEHITLDAVGGVAANSFFCALYAQLDAYKIRVIPHMVKNDFFGHSVNVGGLLTGQDIAAQLQGKLVSKTLLLPHNMLREQEDVFLDGMTTEELAAKLSVRVLPVRGEGEAWVRAIYACAE